MAAFATPVLAHAQDGRVLHVYDAVNDRSRPYIAIFERALAGEGIAFDEAAAAEVGSMDLSRYRAVLIHGMVIAFTTRLRTPTILERQRRVVAPSPAGVRAAG